jgi:hypothetical protein
MSGSAAGVHGLDTWSLHATGMREPRRSEKALRMSWRSADAEERSLDVVERGYSLPAIIRAVFSTYVLPPATTTL